MPTRLEKFLTVTDGSLRLQILLLAIPVLSSLIVMLGAWQLDNTMPPGQYSALTAAAHEAAFRLYQGAAFITFVTCIRIFAKEYRRVRRRLYGY